MAEIRKTQRITKVRLGKAYPLVGLHDQRLGAVRALGLALTGGCISHLELETEWQTICIPWRKAEFDHVNEAFRLKPGAGATL